MPSNDFLLEERIPAGCHHATLSGGLRPGHGLTDLSGDGNVGLLAFNAYDERSERYNMGDTLKAQHTHASSPWATCSIQIWADPCSRS